MSKVIDILVIDDEQVVREGVCRVCEAEGLSIEAVGDAASGLERLRKGAYRLVLCDIMLPDTDGFGVLHAILEEKIPSSVIMITGCSTMQNAVSALKDGAIDFIPKPFTVDELESGIKRGLRYHELAEGGGGTKGAHLSLNCPTGYYRLGGLTWVNIESNGIGTIGVTELFMKTIGKVKSLTAFEVNQDLVQASPCATLEAHNSLVHQVLSPLSGRIVICHEQVHSHPELLEHDPYHSGWLYQVVPSNLAYELNQLIACT